MSASSFFFITNILNFVLATAVFTIPFPMHECGIILGTIILAITCFVSVIACTFIIEALAMKNAIKKTESNLLKNAIESENENRKIKENNDQSEKVRDKKINNEELKDDLNDDSNFDEDFEEIKKTF